MSLDSDEYARELRSELVSQAYDAILEDADSMKEVVTGDEFAESLISYYLKYLEKNDKAVTQVIKDHYLKDLGYKVQELMNRHIDDRAIEDVEHQVGE